MKIFLSYPSGRRDSADRLRLALEAEHHEVFFDRSELRSGEYFHASLREAIEAADLLVFLVTPASVARGSYCLTELGLAEQRWRRPGGNVLPVMVEPTPTAALPPYLQAVTVLQPQGDMVAEVVAAVARMRSGPGPRMRRYAAAGLVLLALGAGAGAWKWQLDREAQARRAAADQRIVDEAGRLGRLCSEGSHAAAWAGLAQLPEPTTSGAAAWRAAREGCAMAWLRDARVIVGQQTFAQLVAPLKPVLADGLAAGAESRHAADLRAHLGWAAFLERREGSATEDPIPHYRRALELDADNVYALAMWGHNLLFRWQDPEGGRERLERAMTGTRERAYAQGLALSQALEHEELHGWALQIANRMRLQGTPMPEATSQRFWSSLFARTYRADHAARWIGSLPPADALATFEWLYPPDRMRTDRLDPWNYVQARLRIDAGQRDAARTQLQALQQRLATAKDRGGLAQAVDAALRGLRAPP